jgi:hypothetical protein
VRVDLCAGGHQHRGEIRKTLARRDVQHGLLTGPQLLRDEAPEQGLRGRTVRRSGRTRIPRDQAAHRLEVVAPGRVECRFSIGIISAWRTATGRQCRG